MFGRSLSRGETAFKIGSHRNCSISYYISKTEWRSKLDFLVRMQNTFSRDAYYALPDSRSYSPKYSRVLNTTRETEDNVFFSPSRMSHKHLRTLRRLFPASENTTIEKNIQLDPVPSFCPSHGQNENGKEGTKSKRGSRCFFTRDIFLYVSRCIRNVFNSLKRNG